MKQKVLIIIPAYNEAKNLDRVIESLKADQYATEYDYVIINDGSTDNTRQLCMERGYSFVDLPCNLGIGGAVQTGYLYAYENGYDVAVQIDGDGQHNVEFLHKGIDVLNQGYDMVIGSRFIEPAEGFKSSFMRRIGIKMISKTLKLLTRHEIRDITSGYRICNRSLIEFYAKSYEQEYPEPQAVLNALVFGYKVCEFPVVMNERKTGKSSINGWKNCYYMIQVILTLYLSYFRAKKEKRKRKVK